MTVEPENKSAVNGEEKIYKLGDTKYTLKTKQTLKLLNASKSFFIDYRKRLFFRTAGIPMKEVETARDNIADKETALEQAKEIIDDPESPETLKAEMQKETKRLQSEIDELKDALKNDEYLQSLIDLSNSCENLAFDEILSDEEIMKPILSKILNGPVVDFEHPDIWLFIPEVIGDFLGFIQQLKRK